MAPRYEDAIRRLNQLQSSADSLARMRALGTPLANSSNGRVAALARFRELLKQLCCEPAQVPILHVAGTKGKGSTCSYLASILKCSASPRHPGFKVGLFTSPHIVEVRERFRINGAALPKDRFANHFFDFWQAVQALPGLIDTEKPLGYFPFLTALSFYIFKKEAVDVLVYETGIGGEYDYTNVIEQPVAAGITTLGIDHVSRLGHTLQEIAWHKGGIFKTGSRALTVEQDDEALEVLSRRAEEKQTTLEIIPTNPELGPYLSLSGPHQVKNASLAVAMYYAFINDHHPNDGEVSQGVAEGLRSTTIPGRAQVLRSRGAMWHLDIAHTAESLMHTVQWFFRVAKQGHRQILVFNHQSLRRKATDLLDGVSRAQTSTFDYAVFTTNLTGHPGPVDLENNNVSRDDLVKLILQEQLAEHWRRIGQGTPCAVTHDVMEAIEFIEGLGDEPQVLVTGEPHLVGSALWLLNSSPTYSSE